MAEEKLGRKLKPGEIPHHINGDKQDNRPENIQIMASIAHHRQAHRKKKDGKKLIVESNPMIQCACGCGKWFSKFDSINRPRKYISGHNPKALDGQYEN